MANRYAVATGNWSSLATWDGGASLPGSGDTVRPNGYTVTIDQDITVTELKNDASSPAVAGGQFVLSSGKTINANITAGSVANTVTFSAASPAVGTINGNVTGSGTANTTISAVQLNGTGTLNVTGTITGGPIYFTPHAILVSAAGTLNVTGNVTGGGYNEGNQVAGIRITAAGTVNITGNVTATTFGPGVSLSSAATNATVTITGNVSGNSTGTARSLYLTTAAGHGILIEGTSAFTITINRNVTGGVANHGIYAGGTSSFGSRNLRINGNVTAGDCSAIYFDRPTKTTSPIVTGKQIGRAHV